MERFSAHYTDPPNSPEFSELEALGLSVKDLSSSERNRSLIESHEVKTGEKRIVSNEVVVTNQSNLDLPNFSGKKNRCLTHWE